MNETRQEMPQPERPPKIKVRELELPLDPSITILDVEIDGDSSSWRETLPNADALHWFLRGVQAGANMYGGKMPMLPLERERVSVKLAEEDDD